MGWMWSGHGDVVNPAVYTQCAAPRENSPLLFVVPVVHSQTPRLLASLEQWTRPEVLAACSSNETSIPPGAPKPDLLVWFDLPVDHPMVQPGIRNVQRMIERTPALRDEVIGRCFGSLRFDSANLTLEQSRNSYWIHPLKSIPRTEGSNRQFFALFDYAPITASYEHLQIMEPDMFPVRAGWVDAVAASARSAGQNFWIKGSIMRFEQAFSLAIEPYRSMYQYHINGNALYRVGDPCFNAFLRDARRHGNCELWCYDTCINIYLHSLRNANLYHTTAHHFLASDVVAHMGGRPFDLAAFRAQSPGTFLVHGKSHFVSSGV
mmetsp:Transcript_17498/g.38003  ORF Transcript_17498/g.38003 Transcript_17498/m.38003 type:complete len:320 (+) Transcript_17498:363-1322(+)